MAEERSARHIVLVHGAWQGAWAFDAWLAPLAARGWQAHAVDLPGNGWPPLGDAAANLQTCTAHVAAVVCAVGAPVVLLGHSGGGIVASQVAEEIPECVAALVYLAGMMLPSGTSYAELVRDTANNMARDKALMSPDADLSGISPWLDWNDDRSASTVRPEGALRHFFHDCDQAAAVRAASLLRPQPESGRAMRNTLGASRFGRVPRLYVECTGDRSVLPVLQRQMQNLSPGALCIAMDCGHVPQLAQPQQLTDLLMPQLEAVLAQPRADLIPTRTDRLSPQKSSNAAALKHPHMEHTLTEATPSTKPTEEQMLRHLRRSNEVAQRAMSLGHHPFGAVLVGPDHETVLLEQCNIDTVNHAESTLARVAASNYTPEWLWGCTLYTAVEPCCMCAGTAYWANIGRVVFGITEAQLLEQTGNHGENPTMSVSSRYVFDHGQKPVDLIGPVEAIAAETIAMQRAFWAQR